MGAFEEDTLNDLRELIGNKLSELLVTYQEVSARLFEDIVAAVEDGNRDQLRHSAHSLKGASGNLGAMDVYRCCDALERVAEHGSLVELHELLQALTHCHSETNLELKRRFASS